MSDVEKTIKTTNPSSNPPADCKCEWDIAENEIGPITKEEHEYEEEMNRICEEYGNLRNAYYNVLCLEQDPQRKRILAALLEELNEENK